MNRAAKHDWGWAPRAASIPERGLIEEVNARLLRYMKKAMMGKTIQEAYRAMDVLVHGQSIMPADARITSCKTDSGVARGTHTFSIDYDYHFSDVRMHAVALQFLVYSDTFVDNQITNIRMVAAQYVAR